MQTRPLSLGGIASEVQLLVTLHIGVSAETLEAAWTHHESFRGDQLCFMELALVTVIEHHLGVCHAHGTACGICWDPHTPFPVSVPSPT